MSVREVGSYIGYNRVTSSSQNSASGIWSLAAAERRTRAGSWPPTNFDQNFSSVSLLLHGDGSNNGTTFTDSSSLAKSVTALGDTVTSTAQSKFGGASLYFPGIDDQLLVGSSFDSDVAGFGTGDFVIECWFRTSVTNARMALLAAYNASVSPSTGITLQLNQDTGGGAVAGSVSFGYGDASLVVTGGSIWSADTWHHLAVARAGTTIRLFIDGTQQASATDTTNISSGATLVIGGLYVSTMTSYVQDYNGYIDDLRITKGTDRGYTGSTITVPTAAYPDA